MRFSSLISNGWNKQRPLQSLVIGQNQFLAIRFDCHLCTQVSPWPLVRVFRNNYSCFFFPSPVNEKKRINLIILDVLIKENHSNKHMSSLSDDDGELKLLNFEKILWLCRCRTRLGFVFNWNEKCCCSSLLLPTSKCRDWEFALFFFCEFVFVVFDSSDEWIRNWRESWIDRSEKSRFVVYRNDY